MLDLNELRACYERLVSILGEDADSFEAVRAAEEHRHYWRPANPRVVLLAESHVHTEVSELQPMRGRSSVGFETLPSTFVRLVYCLGYGENEFVGRQVPANRGTPQFWKIFYSCLHPVANLADFSPVMKKDCGFGQRIDNKLSLLQQLKWRGIWLLDASIVSLYRPGGTRPYPKRVACAIQASWDGYVRRRFEEAAAMFTAVVGKGVELALRNRLQTATGGMYKVFPQPQARLASKDHFELFRSYHGLCRRYAG